MDGTFLVNLDECRKFAKTWLNGEVCSALKCIFLSVLAVLGKVYLKVLTLFLIIALNLNPMELFSTPPKISAQQGFLVVVRHVVT